jgi:hypothetical protein
MSAKVSQSISSTGGTLGRSQVSTLPQATQLTAAHYDTLLGHFHVGITLELLCGRQGHPGLRYIVLASSAGQTGMACASAAGVQ